MNYLRMILFPLEMFIFLYMGKVFFNINIKRSWIIIFTFTIYMGMIIKNPSPPDYFAVFVVLLELLSSFFIIQGKITEKITVIMKIFFIVSCMDGITRKILDIFLADISNYKALYLMLNNTMSLFMLIIIHIIIKKYDVKYNGVVRGIIYFCAAIMGVVIIIAIMETEVSANDVGNTRYIMSNIMIIIYYMSIMSIVLFILYVNNMNRRISKHLETELILKETQKDYYESMLEKEEKTRMFRHDMINHLICLNYLIARDQKGQALDYIGNLQEDMRRIQQKCYDVENEVIDAMLNYYLGLLDEDTHIMISGKCTKKIAIGQVELCTIFSNLVKNAVEALNSQKEGEKYIKILFNTGKKNIKIEITNSINQTVIRESSSNKNKKLPETSKEDKRNHGIGLKNVKETVEKRHGIFFWEKRESEFMVQVILPCLEDEIK